MQPPACLRVLLQNICAQRTNLIGHGHTGGIGKGYLIDADRKVGLNDGVYIFNGSAPLPRGGKRHGDGAGDRDAVRLCELYAGGKPSDTLLRRHVKIVQIMLAAGGNIQLDFFAATVNGALYTAYIWDQRTQLHIRHIADFAEQLVCIRHLRHGLWVHERADFDDRKARINERVEHTELLGGGNQCLFILQAVAQADLTKGNRRGNIHALDLLKKNKMGKAYI